MRPPRRRSSSPPVDEPGQSRAVVVVCGPVNSPQAKEIYARVEELLAASQLEELICDLRGVVDLSIIDVIARLQLLSQRRNVRLRVRATSSVADLDQLLHYLGLTGLVGLKTRGEPEAGE